MPPGKEETKLKAGGGILALVFLILALGEEV
jgi:hypothetical protein